MFRPERFSVQELDLLAKAHSEVVAFAMTTGGGSRWVWVADGWPDRKDTTTLR